MHSFKARLQFPEGVVGAVGTEIPNGANVLFRGEEFGGWTVGSKSGKGEVEMSIPPRQFYQDSLLDIEKLNPTFSVSILVRSVQVEQDQALKGQNESWKAMILRDNAIENYFQGSFQYEWRGIYFNRNFVVPILYDKQTRMITTSTIYENPEDVGFKLVRRHQFM